MHGSGPQTTIDEECDGAGPDVVGNGRNADLASLGYCAPGSGLTELRSDPENRKSLRSETDTPATVTRR